MSNSADRLKWHPEFYAAAGLELRENINELEMISEYNLSKEPIRIDLLILKDRQTGRLKNEISHLMRTYNIIEYKSPDDGLRIDDFYKTLGYAYLYKGYGSAVNQVSIDEVTVSLFREAYPREMMMELKNEGYILEEKYPGIYYVKGMLILIQVIVTGQLGKEQHSALRILSNHADKEDIERFLLEAKNRTTQMDRENIDAVLQVSGAANYQLYEEIRRDDGMCEVMERLMKDVIDERVEKAAAQGLEQGVIRTCKRYNATVQETILQLMEDIGYDEEKAALAVKKYW